MSKGIDIPIEALKTELSNNLFLSNTCNWYGRANWNEFRGGQLPEVLTAATTDYVEVMLDDNYDLTCFFLPEPEIDVDNKIQTANVGIYFSVNLATLYPTVTERATEYLIEDLMKYISVSEFEVEKIITGFAAFSEFGLITPHENMQPYFLIKFETNVQYHFNQC